MKWSSDTTIEAFLVSDSSLGFHMTSTNSQSTTSKILITTKYSLNSS